MSRSTARNRAQLFAALGDETRLALVTRLCDRGPQSISQLAEGSPLTRQAITKHLRTMHRARIVRERREGRESIWQLDPPRFAEARAFLDRISAHWDSALDRLRASLEG